MASRIGTGQEPVFESPFKPPPGVEDLIADMEQDTGFPYRTTVGGIEFRYRVPGSRTLLAFVAAQSEHNHNKDIRVQQMALFVHGNIHPEDAAELMYRLIDDDDFGETELKTLLRRIGTAGTARPTGPLSHWQRQRLRIGEKSVRA